jgi:hypothetical protein
MPALRGGAARATARPARFGPASFEVLPEVCGRPATRPGHGVVWLYDQAIVDVRRAGGIAGDARREEYDGVTAGMAPAHQFIDACECYRRILVHHAPQGPRLGGRAMPGGR